MAVAIYISYFLHLGQAQVSAFTTEFSNRIFCALHKAPLAWFPGDNLVSDLGKKPQYHHLAVKAEQHRINSALG